MEPDSPIINRAYECNDYIEECQVANISDNFRWVNMKANAIPQSLKTTMFDIFSKHMKTLYMKTWGWEPDELWKEMFSDKSCFLILFEKERETISAFCHFQVVALFTITHRP